MREAEPLIPGEPVYPSASASVRELVRFCGQLDDRVGAYGRHQVRDRILAGVDSLMAMPYWLEKRPASWPRRRGHGRQNGHSRRQDWGFLKGGGAQLVGYDIGPRAN